MPSSVARRGRMAKSSLFALMPLGHTWQTIGRRMLAAARAPEVLTCHRRRGRGFLHVFVGCAAMAKKFAAMLLLFGGVLARGDPGVSQSVSLEGSWSGGGPVTFASGLREQARCRAHYRRRSNEGYVVTTVCATASARAEQTATLGKIGE